MPGLDGTGPMGQGSGTGRGLGRCNPDNNINQNNMAQRHMGGAFRRGCGRGFGGRGFRRNWDVVSDRSSNEGKKS